MNREPGRALERAGFGLVEVEPFQIYTPGLPAFPMRWIRAALERRPV